MTEYLCWAEDSEPERGLTMRKCYDAEDAAREFAEALYVDSAGECGQSFNVVVRDGDTDRVFEIEVDYSPSFLAREKEG